MSVIGRFTQEDRYRGDGLNLYAYCGNNPVNYIDPTGYAKTQCQLKEELYQRQKLRKEGKLKESNYKNGNNPEKGTRGTDKSTWKAQQSGYKSGTRMPDEQLLRPKTNTNGTNNITEWRRSISPDNIKAERIKFLGDDAVKLDSGTWRSLDGTRQFRSVPND